VTAGCTHGSWQTAGLIVSVWFGSVRTAALLACCHMLFFCGSCVTFSWHIAISSACLSSLHYIVHCSCLFSCLPVDDTIAMPCTSHCCYLFYSSCIYISKPPPVPHSLYTSHVPVFSFFQRVTSSVCFCWISRLSMATHFPRDVLASLCTIHRQAGDAVAHTCFLCLPVLSTSMPLLPGPVHLSWRSFFSISLESNLSLSRAGCLVGILQQPTSLLQQSAFYGQTHWQSKPGVLYGFS